MKKIISCLFAIAIFAGCAKSDAQTLAGNEYTHDHDGTTVTLGFHPTENRVFGKVVNRYFGTYTVEGNQITFGAMGSTMMMGPEDKMKAEYEMLQFYPTVKTYELNGDTLILKNGEGEEMTFTKTGTVNP